MKDWNDEFKPSVSACITIVRQLWRLKIIDKPFGGIGGLANGVKAGIAGIVTGIPGINGTPLMVPGVGTFDVGGACIGLCWKFDIILLNYFKYF